MHLQSEYAIMTIVFEGGFMNRVFAFLLCVGNAFSMEDDFSSLCNNSKAHVLMEHLIYDTIYSRELPSQDEIRSVIYQCLDLFEGNGCSVRHCFYEVTPERANRFLETAQLLDELSEAFHNEFYKIRAGK